MPDCETYNIGIDQFLQELEKEAYEKRMPYKGVFELTPRCNFNCNMCYVHLKPEQIPSAGRELSTGEWLEIGREAQKAGIMELTLTGGEPFVRSDFRQLYEAFHDMGFLIQIFSNGYLIDETAVRWLKERPPKAVRFTLYGASDESYEKVCGIRDGFSRVKKSVDLLKQNSIPLYLVATITKENQHELDQIYRFARDNHMPIIHTDSLIQPVRGAQSDVSEHQVERKLPPREVIMELRKRNKGKYPRKICTDPLSVCGNYRKGCWVTWSGNMQLCAFLTEPAVPVHEGHFMDAWHDLLNQVEQLRWPEDCEECKYAQYCDRCPGILYAEAGENGKISKSICRQAEFNYLLYGKPLDKEDGE